jgi:NNP family nitrate/nitrite transporter-like MFS transporter
VDPKQGDKSSQIKLFTGKRPHMRAFHMSWLSFFCAFFIWFALAPLMPEVKKSLNLSKQQAWTSNIVAVSGTIFLRFLLGPVCDKYGARLSMGGMLMFASIPTACTGLAKSAMSLYIIRFFIGFAGSTFVMCQYWSSSMFTKEVVGTANAVTGGWGNLGGGVTQLIMGSVLLPLFKKSMTPDMAWRTVSLIPAAITFVVGAVTIIVSDDCPKGNYAEMKKWGTMPEISASASFRTGALNLNTWIMALHYACSFGVELTTFHSAVHYFQDNFDLTTERAAALASIFGWMNIFSRAMGGLISDIGNAKAGMKGRLAWQAFLLIGEGISIFILANVHTLGGAITIMTIFGLFCQAANGSAFGIVPYINPPVTGSISGIVGAGGNLGAVFFGLGFRNLTEHQAFNLMAAVVLVAGVSTACISIKGHRGLICGQDSPEVIAAWKKLGSTNGTLTVPEKDVESSSDKDTDKNSEAEFNQFMEYVSEKNITVEK